MIGIDGIFGEETRDAVYAFQNKYGLAQDGIVGRDTWNKLQDVYRDIYNSIPRDYTFTYGELLFPGTFLTLGNTDKAVTYLQQALEFIARYDPSIPKVEVTGVYDKATENAVKEIQRREGYEVNGVTGPLVWKRVFQLANEYSEQ